MGRALTHVNYRVRPTDDCCFEVQAYLAPDVVLFSRVFDDRSSAQHFCWLLYCNRNGALESLSSDTLRNDLYLVSESIRVSEERLESKRLLLGVDVNDGRVYPSRGSVCGPVLAPCQHLFFSFEK